MSGFKPNPNLLADNLAAGYSNPILYLPMTDASTAHINEGTGGNFVQNGTLATADRGANQNNCVASEFDGVDDYLSSTSIGAATDKNKLTFAIHTAMDLSAINDIFGVYDGGSALGLQFRVLADGSFNISAADITDTHLLNISTSSLTFIDGRSYSIAVSIDLSDSTKTRMSVDGVIVPLSFSTFTDGDFHFAGDFIVGGATSQNYCGSLGELYFDTVYIPLDEYNPFWIED